MDSSFLKFYIESLTRSILNIDGGVTLFDLLGWQGINGTILGILRISIL